MQPKITIRTSLVVRAAPAEVWDYTQDYTCRPDWDASIRRARIIAISPQRTVAIRGAGGLACTFRYKCYDRPLRTSLAMEDVRSCLIVGGGGAWRYEPVDCGTRWTQVNTIIFRESVLIRLALPVLRGILAAATRRAMLRARRRIESGQTAPSHP